MTPENTPQGDVFINPNTDNLDDFEKLLSGTAKPLTETPPEPTEDDLDEVEDNTDAGEVDPPETEDEPIEPPKEEKKKSRFQARIDDLTAKTKEFERLYNGTQMQLEQVLAKLNEQVKPDLPKVEIAPEGVPTADDLNEDGTPKYALGEFDPMFIRALTKFTINQETAIAKAQMLQEQQQAQFEQERQAINSQWAEKLTKAKADYPDLEEGNRRLQETFATIDPRYGDYLSTTIMTMDHGPEVLHYLGEHIEEAKSIAASGATKATLALGRIEARFADAALNKTNVRVSQAAAPPPTRTRGSSGSVPTPGDTDDLDAFERAFYQK